MMVLTLTVMFMLYRVVVSEPFSCCIDSEGYAFLSKYPDMVRWWLHQGLGLNQTFSAFRNQHYSSWKNTYTNYNSQHAQTSSTLAYTALKNTTQLVGEGMWMNSFVVVSSSIVKIEDGKLFFPTRQFKKAQIKLVPKTTTQRILLDQAQSMCWQIGQVLLTHTFCVIPFTKFTDVTAEKDPIIQALLK
jgi:hypothetical protein